MQKEMLHQEKLKEKPKEKAKEKDKTKVTWMIGIYTILNLFEPTTPVHRFRWQS